jgi:hypothetical protein
MRGLCWEGGVSPLWGRAALHGSQGPLRTHAARADHDVLAGGAETAAGPRNCR